MTQDPKAVAIIALDIYCYGGSGTPTTTPWSPLTIGAMTAAIAAADAARGRSYFEWRRPEEWVPVPMGSPERLIILDWGSSNYDAWRTWSDSRLPSDAVAWAEMPGSFASRSAPPAYASVYEEPDLSLCRIRDGCDSRDYCRGQAICRYTGTALSGPGKGRKVVPEIDHMFTARGDKIERRQHVNPERAHAICLSRMVELLLNEVDRDTLARMRRAAYPESGE